MTLTNAQWAEILTSIEGLAEKLDSLNVQPFKDAFKNLVAVVAAPLPTKLDGTPFTDDELHQMAVEAAAPWDEALQRSR